VTRHRVRRKRNGSTKKVANSLVAMSAAAVLTVYTAGYVRTRAAAERFAVSAASRRPAAPRMASALPPALTVAAPPTPTAVAPNPPAATFTPPSVDTTPRAPSSPALKSAADVSSKPVVPTPPASAPNAVPAPTPAPAPVASAAAEGPTHDPSEDVWVPRGRYKDGTYLGWGYSRHGDIQASVEISNGNITSAVIAQCLTRYSCDVIERLPPQVVKRQSPDVDYVSGATQSADAFYGAVVDALSKAK